MQERGKGEEMTAMHGWRPSDRAVRPFDKRARALIDNSGVNAEFPQFVEALGARALALLVEAFVHFAFVGRCSGGPIS